MNRLCRRFSLLRTDQRGSVLMIFGLAFITLVVVAGAGYDLGRQQLVKMKLQQASDAAALAGALLPNGTSAADRQAEALRYFQLNFPTSYLGFARPTPTISVSTTVQVTARFDVPTSFVNNIGVTTLAAIGSSTTLLRGVNIDYDVVMVVDESGSTSQIIPRSGGRNAIEVERDAITQMLDIIFPPGPVNPNVRFGLVGYTQFISNKWGLTSVKADAVTAVSNLNWRNMNYDHYGLEAGFNMITGNTNPALSSGVVPPPAPRIYDCVRGAVLPSAFIPGDFCLIRSPYVCRRDSGAACDKEMFSMVTRNTDVPPPRTVRSDGAPVSPVKNVVFLTDGYIMVEPSGCSGGNLYGDRQVPGEPCPNYPRFLQQCQRLKDAGANVFVISFVSQTAGDRLTLERCASVDPVTGNPRYYFAPDGATLRSVLRNIGVTISKVRIFQ